MRDQTHRVRPLRPHELFSFIMQFQRLIGPSLPSTAPTPCRLAEDVRDIPYPWTLGELRQRHKAHA